MAILFEPDMRTVVLGATGGYGREQLRAMQDVGTDIAGLVSPGRGGSQIEGLPVFDTAVEAVETTGAKAAVVYLPAPGIRDTVVELAEAGIRLAVVAAEFVPVHDTMVALAQARSHGLWVVGPNTLGMAVPGRALLGAIGAGFTRPGPFGVVGRSGTLTLTCTRLLSRAGCGQSTVVHAGGDLLAGRNPHEYLEAFLHDPATRAIVLLGEIGGGKEYAALDIIRGGGKPVLALITGRHAPPGRQMGHAGALIGSDRETATAKREALREAGVLIADDPEHLARLAVELGLDG